MAALSAEVKLRLCARARLLPTGGECAQMIAEAQRGFVRPIACCHRSKT